MDSFIRIKSRLDILDIELAAIAGKYKGSSGWRYDASKSLFEDKKYQQLIQLKKMSELLATKSI